MKWSTFLPKIIRTRFEEKSSPTVAGPTNTSLLSGIECDGPERPLVAVLQYLIKDHFNNQLIARLIEYSNSNGVATIYNAFDDPSNHTRHRLYVMFFWDAGDPSVFRLYVTLNESGSGINHELSFSGIVYTLSDSPKNYEVFWHLIRQKNKVIPVSFYARCVEALSQQFKSLHETLNGAAVPVKLAEVTPITERK